MKSELTDVNSEIDYGELIKLIESNIKYKYTYGNYECFYLM